MTSFLHNGPITGPRNTNSSSSHQSGDGFVVYSLANSINSSDVKGNDSDSDDGDDSEDSDNEIVPYLSRSNNDDGNEDDVDDNINASPTIKHSTPKMDIITSENKNRSDVVDIVLDIACATKSNRFKYYVVYPLQSAVS
mmetsp:Transcript_41542/g.47359  ORF Transcript_41542/g.47359 Transcript_41542/m.47359 type:complete len:139 (-) Transcript_41542:25-441(-)